MSFRGEQVIKGTTYVFEAIAQWDADKQQSRQKRIYIGKKDPVTGAFLPNKKYYELYGEDADTMDFQTSSIIKSVDFGNTYLMYLPKNHFIKEESLPTENYLSYFYPFNKPAFRKNGIESGWSVTDREGIAITMAMGNAPQAVAMELQKGYAERYDWIVREFTDLAFTFMTSFLYYMDYDMIDEQTRSLYRQGISAFGGISANAKAKANAATAIPELIQIASNPAFEENHKEKHNKNAKYGWYRYDVRFALPIYEENVLVRYNIFHARLLINHAENGRKYLYDILAVKKETSKPYKMYGENPFLIVNNKPFLPSCQSPILIFCKIPVGILMQWGTLFPLTAPCMRCR